MPPVRGCSHLGITMVPPHKSRSSDQICRVARRKSGTPFCATCPAGRTGSKHGYRIWMLSQNGCCIQSNFLQQVFPAPLPEKTLSEVNSLGKGVVLWLVGCHPALCWCNLDQQAANAVCQKPPPLPVCPLLLLSHRQWRHEDRWQQHIECQLDLMSDRWCGRCWKDFCREIRSKEKIVSAFTPDWIVICMSSC